MRSRRTLGEYVCATGLCAIRGTDFAIVAKWLRTGCVVRTVPAKGLCGIQKGQQSGCQEPARSLRTGSGVCASCAGGFREGEVARL